MIQPEAPATPYPATDGVVVHLIGWTGAKAQHVQKYADAWRALPGSPTTVLEVSHCEMGVSESWSESRFEKLASALLSRLAGAPPACKIVLHVFSNGGGTLWTALTRQMRARGTTLPLAGLVFDSCPGSFRSLAAGFNFLWASQRSPIMRSAIVACAPLIVALFSCAWLASLRYAADGLSDAQARYVRDFACYARELHHAPPRLPILYLYSADDALIPPHAVEASAQAHRDVGHCDVLTKRWERSPHVGHLRTDPEGYSKACAEILSKL